MTQPRTRRRFLQIAGLTAVGFGSTLVLPRTLQSSHATTKPTVSGHPDLPLQDFDFEVVTVNARGKIIKRQRHQAQFFSQDLGRRASLAMVAIPGGSFVMGAPETEQGSRERERPQHQVTVKPFYMSKYPITQAQWRAVAALPQINQPLKPNPSRFQGNQRPVEQVSWYDAQEFCARLARQTGMAYQLPTEAQWQYASRAGTTTPFYFGETITSKLANYQSSITYASERKGIYREQTTPVGSFPPNVFGLYDMHGNVWEWSADLWHENYQDAPSDDKIWELKDKSVEDNPTGLSLGGSWATVPQHSRSAFRQSFHANLRLMNIGFRVVCSRV